MNRAAEPTLFQAGCSTVGPVGCAHAILSPQVVPPLLPEAAVNVDTGYDMVDNMGPWPFYVCL